MALDEQEMWDQFNQEECMFGEGSLLVQNHRDAVKDHCHITGKYRGAAHNDCNLKLRLNPKTSIPVVFHNLQGIRRGCRGK